MRRLRLFSVVASAFLVGAVGFVATPTAHAQSTSVPALMNFQGRLTKPDGTPVPNGTYKLAFRIYSAGTGGVKRWEQTIDPVIVNNGVFAVLLGSGNPLSADVFNGTPHLEI